MLNIDVKSEGREAVLTLGGKLDANTASELKQKLEELPEEVKDISLDLSGLAYTSSAGLRLFMQYHNKLGKAGGKLVLIHPNEMICEIFDDTGMTGCLNIEK